MTHDYKRHGTTTLFAALDTATGAVLTYYRPRHPVAERGSSTRPHRPPNPPYVGPNQASAVGPKHVDVPSCHSVIKAAA